MKQLMTAATERATDTEEILISRIDDAADMFERHFPGLLPLIIADSITFEVAGVTVEAALRSLYPDMSDPIVLPGVPRILPEESTADDIAALLKETSSTPVAVGSGTINDIVKLAAHRAGRSYMVIATAASMDGYASFGASMLVEGRKTTIPCPAPRAVIADPAVLLSAPRDMTSSGYADLVGKITAGADWIIADSIGVENIDREVWGMVQTHLSSWIDQPQMIHEKNPDTITKLFSGLAISALAMQAYHDTRPASGTEHLFSHVWEMEHLEYDNEPVSHGFKVGIGTLAASALIEVLFENHGPGIIADIVAEGEPPISKADRRAEVEDVFGETPFSDAITDICIQKHPDEKSVSQRRARAAESWVELRRLVEQQVVPFHKIRNMLKSAGCPVHPAEIGVSRERFASTFRKAQMIRSRYTALDLAYDLNLLDTCIDLIFSTNRFFE